MQGAADTADGRTLAYCQWGDPDGWPVFVLHGTPGSRFSRHPDDEVFSRARVRAITYDRAGYGRSTRQPGRCVADAARDVAAIADSLGLERFAVTGASGGGPHALACAALLAPRVTRCATVGGPAPLGAGGLSFEKFIEGMAAFNVAGFERAVSGEPQLRPYVRGVADEVLAGFEADPIASPFGRTRELSAADHEMVSRDAIRAMLVHSTREGIATTVDGFVDDLLALTRPWGFEVSTIGVPVAVWYGPDDVLIPPTHGEWLTRNASGAIATLLTGGHFAVYDQLPRLMEWLSGRG